MGKTVHQVIDSLLLDQRVAVEEREAVLVAEEQERLRADVVAGLRDLDEGKTSPFDDAAVERIKQRGRQTLAKQ
jgi:hypothetical protein